MAAGTAFRAMASARASRQGFPFGLDSEYSLFPDNETGGQAPSSQRYAAILTQALLRAHKRPYFEASKAATLVHILSGHYWRVGFS